MIIQRNIESAGILLNRISPLVRLQPKEGTPLARVVRESVAPCVNLEKNPSELDFPTLIKECSDNNEAHALVIDALVAQGISAVQAQLRVIKNDCKDDIEYVFGRVTKEVESVMVAVPKVHIAESSYPKLYDSMTFASLIDPYQQFAYQDITIPEGVFPNLTPAEAKQLLMCGDSEIDGAVEELVAVLPVTPQDIYNKHYRKQSVINYPNPQQMVEPYFVYYQVIESALLFLMSLSLQQNPIANINLSAQELKLLTTTLCRKYGASCNKNLSARERILQSGDVFFTTRRKDETTTIVVYQENYIRWLTDGDGDGNSGSVEVLVGMYLRDVLLKFNSIPSSRYEEYQRAYERYMQNEEVLLKEKRSAIVTAAVAKAMEKLLASEVDYTILPLPKDQYLVKMRDVISKRAYFDSDDVYQYCRRVVCRVLYEHLQAESFLTAMDKYQEEQPNLTPRECALLATRQLITDYLWSQCQVIR